MPPPPHLVQLDTLNGGQLYVPVSWLEARGIDMRAARVILTRPPIIIVDGVPVEQSDPLRSLPPDSIGLWFQEGGSLVAYFAAQPSGRWIGRASLQSPRAADRVSVIPMRLEPTVCGTERMARSR